MQDLTPEAGDNVELTLVVADSNGAMAVNQTCIVQVFSQPGSDAYVEPLVTLTGADGEATTTLFAGSTPGAVEVSTQCGNTPAAVITLNVGGASVPASFPGASIAAFIAQDLAPVAGDNVELTVVVVDPNGAMAENEICIVQVLSQPGTDASINPMVVTTDADGEATTTLIVGSTPGVIEVSTQCGAVPAAVITLNVAGASVPESAPASLPDTGAGSLDSVAEPVDFWPVLMVALSGALIAAAGFLSFRRQTQLLQRQALPVQQDQPQEPERFVPRMRRLS